MIEFQNASVSVPVWGTDGRQYSKTILQPVTLKLAAKKVAVIGPNGSGKSTFLRLINGLVKPSAGRVLVDGFNTVTDGKKVRQRVGFIFTDPLSQLVQSTPVEDISLSLRASVKNRQERQKKAIELLEHRGLGALAHQSIYDLSGGERQLVSLTSVLAVNPSILVADEPTTLLDLKNKTEVMEALLGLEMQLVFASHDLEFAKLADLGLVIIAGQIQFVGQPDQAIDFYRNAMT